MILRLSCSAVKGNVPATLAHIAALTPRSIATLWEKVLEESAQARNQKVHRVSLSSKRASLSGKFPLYGPDSDIVQ